MNDPAMMAAANEAFAKMSDEQRRQMQEQVSKFTPEQIAQAQSMMSNMTPEQRAQMAEMASKASPEELLQRSQQAASMAKGVPPGTTSESERLKLEGNALVKERKYKEASERYEMALSTPDLSLETKKAAHLNASLCFLQLGQHDKVVRHSSLVIKNIDNASMKAYYRRGQAFIHKKRKTLAIADLERALELCSESDRSAIEEQLAAAKELDDDIEGDKNEVLIEEVEVVEEVEYEEVVAQSTGSNAGVASMQPPLQPPQMDPASMKQAASMMEGMSDEQLESMLKMGGAPAGVNAAQMRLATKMMENMSAEDIKRMTDMAQKFQGSRGAGAAPPSAEELAKDPDMVATMTSFMKDIDPVSLASMMSSSGVKITPDQAKMMTDSISGMDEKTLARIAKVATFFGRVAALVQRARSYAKQNPAMAIAILVLIIALILRWKGIM